MSSPEDEEGVLTALMLNFEHQHLPKLLDIQKKVEAGNELSEWDSSFLDGLIKEAMRAKPMVDKHPELQSIYAKVAHLYQQITSKALDNAQH